MRGHIRKRGNSWELRWYVGRVLTGRSGTDQDRPIAPNRTLKELNLYSVSYPWGSTSSPPK